MFFNKKLPIVKKEITKCEGAFCSDFTSKVTNRISLSFLQIAAKYENVLQDYIKYTKDQKHQNNRPTHKQSLFHIPRHS